MLRNTLAQVIEMVRDEARLSTNTSRGIDHLAHITRLVKRYYGHLAEKYDFEHLKIKREDAGKAMASGQRYYDFPTLLNLMKIERVWHFWGNNWNPIGYGITPEEYSIVNSDDNIRQDPVQQWQYYGHAQFEVWPMPASASGEVRFEGQKKVEALVDNNSRLDLDDELVALYAASEILGENDRKGAAELKRVAAVDRLGLCKASLSDKGRYIVGAGGRTGGGPTASPRLYPRHPTFIGRGS